MRFKKCLCGGLLMILMATLCGCIAVSSDDEEPITNESGLEVEAETLTLNGFWNGQQDQSGSWRVLIYQGSVYAKDDASGYFGTINYDQNTQTADMQLNAYAFSASDATSSQYLADGNPTAYAFSALAFTATSNLDTLVGDYSTDTTTGSFLLTDDGSWDTSASLSSLIGQWQAGVQSLYVTSLGESVAVKGISSADGCTYEGTMATLGRNQNIYSVTLVERKNCTDFNALNISGYATITLDGTLEFYLRETGSLFFMSYTKVATEEEPAGDTGDTDDTDATDDTGAADGDAEATG